MIDARRFAATDILARTIVSLTADGAVSGTDGFAAAADIQEEGEHGVRAVLLLPSGDRFRVVVEWVGDRESRPAAADAHGTSDVLLVNEDRTELVRLWMRGNVIDAGEIARRDHPSHTWGPPTLVREEPRS